MVISLKLQADRIEIEPFLSGSVKKGPAHRNVGPPGPLECGSPACQQPILAY